jgi:protein-S-isoprenylcysteine O-methyltransferase Ste14
MSDQPMPTPDEQDNTAGESPQQDGETDGIHRHQQFQDDVGIEKFVQRLRNKEVLRQLLGFALVFLYTALAQPLEDLVIPAIVLVTLGIVIRIWAAGTVFKNQILATNGPYSLVRHPLYVGNILTIIGFNLLVYETWAWLLTLGFLWFFYPPAIRYEDGKLQDLFGDAWRQWRRNTPALIPFRVHWKRLKCPWSFRLFAGRNGELGIAIILIFCLVVAIY